MPPGDALDDLTAARPAFMGQTEAEHCARLTDERLRKGPVNWLEVGAGDGANLSFQLARLAGGRDIKAVALEPAPVNKPPAGVTWLRVEAERYRPEIRFDWIGVRHSAYYIADPVAEIARLALALSPGGGVALTHWTDDCVLRRLHLAVCGDAADDATAGLEQLVDAIATGHGLVASPVTVFETGLDVDRVLADPALATALARLLSRGRSLPDDRHELLGRVADVLLSRATARRRNGIVFLSPRR